MIMTPSTSNATHPPFSKTVLYCFECGHESQIDGDWTVRQRCDREIYTCPDCETTIASRPHRASRATPNGGTPGYCSGD